jgi:anti-sigma regulatory factor (Ser/Thr protein kinase)
MQVRSSHSCGPGSLFRALTRALFSCRAHFFPAAPVPENTQSPGFDLLRHELRTPVAGILGMCELLQKSELTGEQFQLASAVEESGKQLLRLISRFGAGFGTESCGTVEGSQVRKNALNGPVLMEQVIRAHWPAARKKGIGLFLLYDHRLPACWNSDIACLRQLLDNLLSNAIKFTGQGHVLVEVRLLQFNPSGRADVELAVCDTGIGIARRDKQRIYQIREQGSGDIGERYGGSGLGLHVCTRMVSLLGGCITHESTGFGGTRFLVKIPGLAVRGAAAFDRVQPRLLSDMRCLLAVRPPLAAVLEQLLLRIGVQVGVDTEPWGSGTPAGEELMICHPASLSDGLAHVPGAPAGNTVALLSRPHPPNAATDNLVQGLVLTPLPQPVLRSNLEPLLMRVALQKKLMDRANKGD